MNDAGARERGRAWTTRNALARACGADDELGHEEEEAEEGEGRLRRGIRRLLIWPRPPRER